MLIAKTCGEKKTFKKKEKQQNYSGQITPWSQLTRSPLSDLMSIIVSTVSYKIALPTFLLVSVFVATCITLIYQLHSVNELWNKRNGVSLF